MGKAGTSAFRKVDEWVRPGQVLFGRKESAFREGGDGTKSRKMRKWMILAFLVKRRIGSGPVREKTLRSKGAGGVNFEQM
jgi:hypothetical protein